MTYTGGHHRSRRVHYLLFILLCLVWGSSFILMKKAALVFGPITIAGLRCATGALILVSLWALFGRRARRPERKDIGWLLLMTVLGYGYPYAVQPYLVSNYGSGFIGMMVAHPITGEETESLIPTSGYTQNQPGVTKFMADLGQGSISEAHGARTRQTWRKPSSLS